MKDFVVDNQLTTYLMKTNFACVCAIQKMHYLQCMTVKYSGGDFVFLSKYILT